MDTLMNASCVAPRKVAIVASCLCLALQICLAQKNSANAPGGTRAVLVEKALAMESRGRPDMAVQIWQQILLADPTSTEALAGLAKDYKLIGSIDNANEALERLRKINPNDPNILRSKRRPARAIRATNFAMQVNWRAAARPTMRCA